jgi:hypothetical protein
MEKITGTKIRTGRLSAHLSQDQLATRAGIHRDCLRAWEGSSDSMPRAQYRTLSCVIDVLEAEGVRFSDGGVHLQRPAPMSTVLHSGGRGATAPSGPK